MRAGLQQKQSTVLQMTKELKQAIHLLQFPTYDLYEYVKEQEAENPLILLDFPPSRAAATRTALQPLDSLVEDTEDMRTALSRQARLNFKDKTDLELTLALIEQLDDNGYLQPDPNFDVSSLSRGISLLQDIGPPGIGARSLAECLLLQVSGTSAEDEAARQLINGHLEEMALGHWRSLSETLGFEIETLKQAAQLIKHLDPKPGTALSASPVHYETPDIIAEATMDGISYFLNDAYMPGIRLNTEYTGMSVDGDVAAYLKEHRKQAEWLIKAVEQRRSTLLKIMAVLASRQQPFFTDGLIALHPLTLNQVALEIGMHESTVSRAVANKVIQTPFGSFALRVLFSSHIESKNGQPVSQTRIKILLQQMIADEDKHRPLSDQKVAALFETHYGIQVARRTVAKYREQLCIPTASLRKKWN